MTARRTGLAALSIWGLAAAAACYDFNADYQTYCLSGRCDDAGGPPPDGGSPDAGQVADGGAPPDSGSTSDAGPADSGPTGDAGPQPCRAWGAGCTASAQCCNALGVDAGADGGVGLGCSQLNECEFRPAGCLPDGYHCANPSDCCNGQCNLGFCNHCASASSGAACRQATDCCFDDGAYCNASDVCAPVNNPEANSHCLSSDFCGSTTACAFDGGSDGGADSGSDAGPPDGLCVNAVGQCTALGQFPGVGGLACCPGTSFSCLPTGADCTGSNGNQLCCSGACGVGNVCTSTGPGDGGSCCLPKGAPCLNRGSCCSNACAEGICADAIVPYPVGHPCVESADCLSGLICDRITQTCQAQFCLPQQPSPGWGGCGTLSGSTLRLLDGGSCLMGGLFTPCTKGADCCSGACFSFPPIVFCLNPTFVP